MTTPTKIYTDENDLRSQLATLTRSNQNRSKVKSDSTGADSFLDDLVESERDETNSALEAFGLSDDRSGEVFESVSSSYENGRSPEIEEAAESDTSGYSSELEEASRAELEGIGRSPTIEQASEANNIQPPDVSDPPSDSPTGYAFEDSYAEEVLEERRRYPGEDAQVVTVSGQPTGSFEAGLDNDDDYGSVIAEASERTDTDDAFDTMMEKANVDNDALVDFEDALEEEEMDLLADPEKQQEGSLAPPLEGLTSKLGGDLSSKLAGLVKKQQGIAKGERTQKARRERVQRERAEVEKTRVEAKTERERRAGLEAEVAEFEKEAAEARKFQDYGAPAGPSLDELSDDSLARVQEGVPAGPLVSEVGDDEAKARIQEGVPVGPLPSEASGVPNLNVSNPPRQQHPNLNLNNIPEQKKLNIPGISGDGGVGALFGKLGGKKGKDPGKKKKEKKKKKGRGKFF